MLEGYFDLDGATGVDAAENHKRLLAVQAALEISKASVSASTANSGIRSQMDLRNVSQEVVTYKTDGIHQFCCLVRVPG